MACSAQPEPAVSELAGVLAHEVAHIANEDLRVMGLADSVSRLTSLPVGLGRVLDTPNPSRCFAAITPQKMFAGSRPTPQAEDPGLA